MSTNGSQYDHSASGRIKRRRLVHNEHHLTVVVLGSLLLKSAAKIATGAICHLPVILLEGIRGSFEIVKHVMVRIVGNLARCKPDDEFPMGKRALFPVISIALAVCSLILCWSILHQQRSSQPA